jgi:hypothetical protein
MMIPVLVMTEGEEMTSFSSEHQPAFSLDCVNFSPQEDFIKPEMKGMNPTLQQDKANFILDGWSVYCGQGLQYWIP